MRMTIIILRRKREHISIVITIRGEGGIKQTRLIITILGKGKNSYKDKDNFLGQAGKHIRIRIHVYERE